MLSRSLQNILATMKLSLVSILFALTVAAGATPIDLEKRQQCETTFRYQEPGYAPPGNYKAFNIGSCSAQLSFDKDRYISVIWAFEATYPDGRVEVFKPYRDFETFGVSDPLYPYLGNNFVTRFPGNSAFTAVHEFNNVCIGSMRPSSWRFYTTSPRCFTSPQILVSNGDSRPAKVSGVQMRRVNDAGDFEVSWTAVPTATAYSVIVEYPTGRDEIGNPYLNVRGARVQVVLLEPFTIVCIIDIFRVPLP